jgi:hypothetical protein
MTVIYWLGLTTSGSKKSLFWVCHCPNYTCTQFKQLSLGTLIFDNRKQHNQQHHTKILQWARVMRVWPFKLKNEPVSKIMGSLLGDNEWECESVRVWECERVWESVRVWECWECERESVESVRERVWECESVREWESESVGRMNGNKDVNIKILHAEWKDIKRDPQSIEWKDIKRNPQSIYWVTLKKMQWINNIGSCKGAE